MSKILSKELIILDTVILHLMLKIKVGLIKICVALPELCEKQMTKTDHNVAFKNSSSPHFDDNYFSIVAGYRVHRIMEFDKKNNRNDNKVRNCYHYRLFSQ